MSVRFYDFSMDVQNAMTEKSQLWIIEASNEIVSQAQRTTPAGESMLKGSWASKIDGGGMSADIGSPLENALWNEYGTGSYAEAGNGRKGWWVYIEGKGKSGTPSKTYANEQEAQKAADFLRIVKKLDAHPSNGKPKQKTLLNAFSATKEKLIRRAEEIFKGE